MVAIAATAMLDCTPARAERADRDKPIEVQSGTAVLDRDKSTAVLAGNVSITQGTLEIHADRAEISEDAAGPKLGAAIGSPGSPAHFRQKGDKPDEWSEGTASRIEYDGDLKRIRFVGDAHLRFLHGTVVTDSVSAPVITYDAVAGTFATSGGRVTLVQAPRAAAASDAPPASAQAASQP